MFPRLNGKEVGYDPLQDNDGARPDTNKHVDYSAVPVKRSLTRSLVVVTGNWLRARLNGMVQKHWSQRGVARKTRGIILCSILCFVWLNMLAISLPRFGMSTSFTAIDSAEMKR